MRKGFRKATEIGRNLTPLRRSLMGQEDGFKVREPIVAQYRVVAAVKEQRVVSALIVDEQIRVAAIEPLSSRSSRNALGRGMNHDPLRRRNPTAYTMARRRWRACVRLQGLSPFCFASFSCHIDGSSPSSS